MVTPAGRGRMKKVKKRAAQGLYRTHLGGPLRSLGR
jgi:hypothetical protein